MADIIDFRSDTVTQPTPAMRRAMAQAEVGDDVYGEDPTVRRLEEVAAERLGKAAGLFFPSGTMANQAAVLAHTRRGDEVLLEEESHIYYYEVGGVALLAGCQVRPLPSRRGVLDPAVVEATIRPANIHFPPPRLLCLENTHNRWGGTVMTAEETAAVAEVAHRHGLKVHLDGARIFNAAVALGVPADRLAAPADSVMFSLSKGLGCPVGSVLVGDREFIAEARRYRKALGGGMRQAGILAAAGLVALDEMIDRLAEDHALARRLAEGLASLPGVRVDMETVQTNMVMADVSGTGRTAYQLAGELAAAGVKVNAVDAHRLRWVTHKDVGPADADRALAIFHRILTQG
ncbi:aminotransferase class I/II-fold pyridoxal phosphate-dependent enzyme [Thermaerobacter sp. PB12/4term]|uniref:threonine aldolase family protein n=1 Tax=Thermaerobacter sp. PB12/4term TaxID=2293838 RepID=UPI000E329676|nr:GntG family PLP-dependent aldolase [Thermaerobacter sp. PB12/4term]QIA27156.1 aminotransferase class I/II-fold pyridoxal phosphate-dependent enzyme [Thermaerobacter sp. PB12/4term]